MTVTRNIKPVGQYHQWSAAEITNGDVLGVWESLGGRCAHSVTIESVGGATTIRLNVVKQIHQNYGPTDQAAGMGQGLPRPAPTLVAEIEESRDDVIIPANVTQTWLMSEISITDIKVVTKAPSLKVTIT